MLLITAPANAQAPRRVALVIGNDTYQVLTPLSNPRLDAGRLAATLAGNGFEVISCDGKRPGCFDLTRAQMLDALDALERTANGADLALIFYAGHGMETARDGNVLAPVDMEVLDCATRALRRVVPLADVFKAMAGARQRIVVLDACRNDPLADCPPVRGSRPVSFTTLTAPEAESFLLVSSTKPGQLASDGLPGAHSPFARALLQWLEAAPDVHFHQLLQLHVSRTVIETTSRDEFTQVPETLVRGVAPEACLKGAGCVSDTRAASLAQEIEALKLEHTRDQELAAIARDYLAVAEKGRGQPLTEEERQQELQRLKEVRDYIVEAEKGRGHPFSREERAQELARLMQAGRALLALNDTRAERALEMIKAGDETEASRLFEEAANARKEA